MVGLRFCGVLTSRVVFTFTQIVSARVFASLWLRHRMDTPLRLMGLMFLMPIFYPFKSKDCPICLVVSADVMGDTEASDDGFGNTFTVQSGSNEGLGGEKAATAEYVCLLLVSADLVVWVQVERAVEDWDFTMVFSSSKLCNSFRN